MYQDFGPVVSGKRVTFRLFLPDNTVDPQQYTRGGSPNIKEIRVRGSFQSAIGGTNWELDSAPVMTQKPHPNGWLFEYEIEQDLPDEFYEYKYFVTFLNETTRWCSDPCTKCSGKGEDENAAFVIGGNDAEVRSIPNRLAPKDLIIYEMMIDDFTAEFRNDMAPSRRRRPQAGLFAVSWHQCHRIYALDSLARLFFFLGI